MLIVGIDPGSMKTGVASIDDRSGRPVGAVSTVKSSIGWPFRYAHVRAQIETIFQWLPERPEAVAIEEPIIDNEEDDPTERAMIRHLEGVYAVICSEIIRTWSGMTIMPWKPREWRGLGMKKKDVMARMAAKYGITLDNDDEGDALGIADHAFMLMRRTRTRDAALRLAPKSGEPPADRAASS